MPVHWVWVASSIRDRRENCVLLHMEVGHYCQQRNITTEQNGPSVKSLPTTWVMLILVYTDNNPLSYIMESSKLNANGQRWVSQLSKLNFKINKVADCLSRLLLDIDKYCELCTNGVEKDCFQGIVGGVKIQAQNEEVWIRRLQAIDTGKLKQIVYAQLHSEMGHLGAERVFQLVSKRVYCSGMSTKLKLLHKECSR